MRCFLTNIAVAVVSGLLTSSCASRVRFNQVQVIGTHNSYHLVADQSLLTLIEKQRPGLAKTLEYSHRPLPEQFSDLGIRQIELDIFADPQGGLYAEPRGNKIAASLGLPIGSNHDPAGLLRQPGFKVMHVQDIDFRATVLTFVAGLRQVRDWSAQHPRHFPICILIELKDEVIAPGFTKPVPFGAKELDAVEVEILTVFKREQILKPDDIRSKFNTLPEALARRGWPRLDAVRGKVLFALDNGGTVRDLYLKDHPALQGRLMFVSAEESDPAAAWMKVNDPIGGFAYIQKLVKAGFIVRTRTDGDTLQARTNDTTQRERAFASGAQFLSTDYPKPNPAFSSYQVRFDGGIVVRNNPVNGNPALNGKDLEK
jgi:hypothetical protein